MPPHSRLLTRLTLVAISYSCTQHLSLPCAAQVVAAREDAALPPAQHGAEVPLFRRGDVDQNGRIDIADTGLVLRYVFGRGAALACEDGADLDDDGRLGPLDGLLGLQKLFENGRIAAPVEACGLDPTVDGLGCQSPPECGGARRAARGLLAVAPAPPQLAPDAPLADAARELDRQDLADSMADHCCRASSPMQLEVHARDKISATESCRVTVTPCQPCGREVRLEIEEDSPLRDSWSLRRESEQDCRWMLEPIGPRVRGGCIPLLASVVGDCPSVLPGRTKVHAVAISLRTNHHIAWSTHTEDDSPRWEPFSVPLLVTPDGCCDTPDLIDVTTSNSGLVNASLHCGTSADLRGSARKSIVIQPADAVRPGDRVDILLRVRNRCDASGASAEQSLQLTVEFLEGREVHIAGGKGAGGGGPAPGGGFGGGGNEPPPVPDDPPAPGEFPEPPLDPPQRYRDPCDIRLGSEHQRESTWCWSQGDAASSVELEHSVSEAPPTDTVARQHRMLERLRPSASIEGNSNDHYESFVCCWSGFEDEEEGADDITQHSGEGKLFEIDTQYLLDFFNPRFGQAYEAAIAGESLGCLDPIPQEIRESVNEYGRAEVWMRLYIEHRGTGRIRAAFRGGTVATFRHLDDEDLQHEWPWRTLPRGGEGSYDLTEEAVAEGFLLPFTLILTHSGHWAIEDEDPDNRYRPDTRRKAMRSGDSRLFWIEVFGEAASSRTGDVRLVTEFQVRPMERDPENPALDNESFVDGPVIDLTVVRGKLLETIDAVDLARIDEETEYHHPGFVTPSVRFDSQVRLRQDLATDTDIAMVSGLVKFPMQQLGASGALYINGELVEDIDDEGRFTARVPIEGFYEIIKATAHNQVGGWASDTIQLHGDQVTHSPHSPSRPVLQRLSFGPEEVSAFLLERDVTIALRERVTRRAPYTARLPLALEVEDGEIVSETFAISRHVDNAVDLGGSLDRVLRFATETRSRSTLEVPSSPLEHDLRIEIDGQALCTIEMAGIDPLYPRGSDIVYESAEHDEIRIALPSGPNGEPPIDRVASYVSNDEEIPNSLAAFCRNIEAASFQVLHYSPNSPESARDVTALFETQLPTGSQYTLHEGVAHGLGANLVLYHGRDLAGRPVPHASAHLFAYHAGVDSWLPAEYEVDYEDAMRPPVDGGIAGRIDRVNLRLPSRHPAWVRYAPRAKRLKFKVADATSLGEVNRELDRLGLVAVGYTRQANDGSPPPDGCRGDRGRVFECVPLDGNIEKARAELKSSRINIDGVGFDRSILIPPLDNPDTWPDAPFWKPWYRLPDGGDNRTRGKDRGWALKQAQRNKNLANARTIRDISVGWRATSEQFIVVDMRVDESDLPFDFGFLGEAVSELAVPKILRSFSRAAPTRDIPYQQVARRGLSFARHLTTTVNGRTRTKYRLYEWNYAGQDENRSSPFFASNRITGRNPVRVLYDVQPVVGTQDEMARRGFGLGRFDAELATKRGAIVTLHGFHLTNTATRLNDEGEEDRPRVLWPYLQNLYSTRISSLPGVDASEYAIFHVLWTGDVSPVTGTPRVFRDRTAIYFNWDDAVARYTGANMLSDLLFDIDRAGSRSPDWEGTLIHGNSLGAAVAVEGIRALRARTGLAEFPRLQLVLGHPALRAGDMTRTTFQGLHQMSLPNLLRGMSESAPDSEAEGQSLLFYSRYDKAGLPFELMQGEPMLGRCGPPAGWRFNDPVRMLRMCDVWGGESQGDSAVDTWHVKLFGWALPTSAFVSRPTYKRNKHLYQLGVLEDEKLITRVSAQHVENVWGVIRHYLATGHTRCR